MSQLGNERVSNLWTISASLQLKSNRTPRPGSRELMMPVITTSPVTSGLVFFYWSRGTAGSLALLYKLRD
jgi:hypothetical protein